MHGINLIIEAARQIRGISVNQVPERAALDGDERQHGTDGRDPACAATGEIGTTSCDPSRTRPTSRIAVPLPRGKLLRLGPRKTGQISSDDVEHPPLKKMAEAGEIEIHEEGHSPLGGGGGGVGPSGGPGHGTTPGAIGAADR